jgi:hypothetical protein
MVMLGPQPLPISPMRSPLAFRCPSPAGDGSLVQRPEKSGLVWAVAPTAKRATSALLKRFVRRFISSSSHCNPSPVAGRRQGRGVTPGRRAANLVQAALHSSKTPQFQDLSCRESDLDSFSTCEVAGVIDQANKGGNHEKDRKEIASVRAAQDSFGAYRIYAARTTKPDHSSLVEPAAGAHDHLRPGHAGRLRTRGQAARIINGCCKTSSSTICKASNRLIGTKWSRIKPRRRPAIEQIRFGAGGGSAMALSLDIKIGGSLWSAVAWNRFGSHLQILQTQGTSDAVGLLSIIARVSKWTTKAVPSNRTPKLRADPRLT